MTTLSNKQKGLVDNMTPMAEIKITFLDKFFFLNFHFSDDFLS